jgi:hypothetical protein
MSCGLLNCRCRNVDWLIVGLNSTLPESCVRMQTDSTIQESCVRTQTERNGIVPARNLA